MDILNVYLIAVLVLQLSGGESTSCPNTSATADTKPLYLLTLASIPDGLKSAVVMWFNYSSQNTIPLLIIQTIVVSVTIVVSTHSPRWDQQLRWEQMLASKVHYMTLLQTQSIILSTVCELKVCLRIFVANIQCRSVIALAKRFYQFIQQQNLSAQSGAHEGKEN